jgi:hypothetical protein
VRAEPMLKNATIAVIATGYFDTSCARRLC